MANPSASQLLLILAPMAGFTNHPFRLLCKKYGAGLVFTEMVSAEGLCHGNNMSEMLARVFDDERPAGIQLWGNDPEMMGKASAIVCDKFSPAIIDINAGCPATKVIIKGAGSALLHDRARLCGMVNEVKSAVDGRAKVWVKTRLLPDSESMISLAQDLRDAGADSITVHPRVVFEGQGCSTPIREEMFIELRERAGMPVIWSGGINSRSDAMAVAGRTGCDGVMIARAALGNPFVFSDDDGGQSRKWSERAAAFREFVELCRNDDVPFRDVKAHAVFFPKFVKGAARVRNEASGAKDIEELLGIFFAQVDSC